MKSFRTIAKLGWSTAAWMSLLSSAAVAQKRSQVPETVMQQVYEKIKTPYKYGLVLTPENDSKKVDIRSVFKEKNRWYMVYIVYDGRGYETWLAQSDNLLHWQPQGRLLSFSDSSGWDRNQKAGDVVLQDYNWGGSYKVQSYNGKYWMSYFGGTGKGYEAGMLSISIAFTHKNPAKAHEWQRLKKPVLMPVDKDARWWENNTMYKSTVIWDKARTIGYPFIMYYNAKGDSTNPKRGSERIGMAVSHDMVHWLRYRNDPVLNHHTGITGNAFMQKMGELWVMFYFGAFWKNRSQAFNRFACSYDLVNWTDWNGPNLIEPSEEYDARFAHKSCVIYYQGVVYHFYCAVNNSDQRGIALATSKDLGKSSLKFISN